MPGNYPATLRAVMNARGNWQEVPQDDAIEQCNFVFRPVNYGYQGYDKIKADLDVAFADTDELLGFGQLAAMARADQISPQDE